MNPQDSRKQNVTISLNRDVLKKAKVLAARKETSISGLLAAQIENLVGREDAYLRAERQAQALMDDAFHMGGDPRVKRDDLHDR